MSWLVLHLFLTLNYFPSQGVVLYQNDVGVIDYHNTYGTEFGAKADIMDGLFFIEGISYCAFNRDGSTIFEFVPNFQNYKLGAGIFLFDFLTIGYEHTCFHPVMAYFPLYESHIKQFAEGFYNRLYIKIETKLKFGGK